VASGKKSRADHNQFGSGNPHTSTIGYGFGATMRQSAGARAPRITDTKTMQDGNMSEDVLDSIKEQISENPIILYMKGSPQAPQCGFSAQTVQCMVACGQRFAYVDILSNPEIRATLPGYANWPTFPQLWVDGELVGGCDIITEMFEAGELETLLVETSEKYPAEG
jgi:monothiol glutaredoxin